MVFLNKLLTQKMRPGDDTPPRGARGSTWEALREALGSILQKTWRVDLQVVATFTKERDSRKRDSSADGTDMVPRARCTTTALSNALPRSTKRAAANANALRLYASSCVHHADGIVSARRV